MGSALDELGVSRGPWDENVERRRSSEDMTSRGRPVSPQNSRDQREDSPLTEMTKRFNELVSDLEKMSPSSRAAAAAQSLASSAAGDGYTEATPGRGYVGATPSAAEQLVTTSPKYYSQARKENGSPSPVPSGSNSNKSVYPLFPLTNSTVRHPPWELRRRPQCEVTRA